jgi:hypothetical protein
MDRTVFDDLEVKHEYAMLVGCRLNLLSERQRSEWGVLKKSGAF